VTEALGTTIWNNRSLFLGADGPLIGYVETDSLEASRAGIGIRTNIRVPAHITEK
jgi:hypothetical protein